jgi:hypothetical protein
MAPAVHDPAPLQNEAAVSVPPAHEAAPHVVEGPHFSHAPMLQLPSSPHDACALAAH